MPIMLTVVICFVKLIVFILSVFMLIVSIVIYVQLDACMTKQVCVLLLQRFQNGLCHFCSLKIDQVLQETGAYS